jgi:hypothetical protein
VLWLIVLKCLWPYAAKKHGFDYERQKSRLSWLEGIVERCICTGALLIGGIHGWQAIGVWLAMKVAARWQKAKGEPQPIDSDHIWLIGTAISLSIGILGAWIAMGYLPK